MKPADKDILEHRVHHFDFSNDFLPILRTVCCYHVSDDVTGNFMPCWATNLSLTVSVFQTCWKISFRMCIGTLVSNYAGYLLVSDVTPTDRWLNVWCIWHIYLETLQEFRSRRRIGWIIQDFRETCVSFFNVPPNAVVPNPLTK